jgi:regulator of sigma E protease
MRDEAGTFTEKRIGVWGTDLASFQGADARNGFTLTVQRGREIFSTSLKLMAKEETDDFNNVTTRYVFGAFNDRSLVAPYQYERDVGASEALMASCRQVGADMTLIGKGIYKIFEGVVPLDSMGGPIMLFVIAEKSARRGIDHFLRMLAIISVNLGLLNLLPIPVLDGGHLLMFAIEGIRRRPPSMRIREITNMIGMVILLLLMVLVFSNDIMRFIIG